LISQVPKLQKVFNKLEIDKSLYYDVEFIENPSAEYIKQFFIDLENHKDYKKLKDNFIYDEEYNVLVHIHSKFPLKELEGLKDEERSFYSFMSKVEIKRIFNIKNSEDYLLRLRAEQVQGDMRFKRAFTNLKNRKNNSWSFTQHFETSLYNKYLKKLKTEHRKKCLNIPRGTIHAAEANGMCLKTPFGNIITLSSNLRQFLYYMNLFLFGHNFEVPTIDIHTSFILAVRIMFGKESPDFEIDSRGKLPNSIDREISKLTDWQMSFIIGHEFAHHYLDHLKNSKLSQSLNVLSHKKSHTFYTYRQEQEFEADLNSIIQTSYSSEHKSQLLNGAFYFFAHLFLFDQIDNYLFPRGTYSHTHPKPIDRMLTLRESIKEDIGMSKSELNDFISNTKEFSNFYLTEYVPFHVDQIEMEGSVYLPSYKKSYKIDRLDM